MSEFYTVRFEIDEPDGTVHMASLQYAQADIEQACWPFRNRLMVQQQVIEPVMASVAAFNEGAYGQT